MNSDNQQMIESYVKDGDSCYDNKDWGGAKLSYLRAIEEYQRCESEEMEITPEDKKQLEEIQGKIAQTDEKLAKIHFDLGEAAFVAKDYPRAIDDLEEAINLASEKDVEFLEKTKVLLDKVRLKSRDQEMFSKLDPLVKKGEEFHEDGNYAEAVLEFSDALKACAGLPEEHRYKKYIIENILECKRQLVKPYLSKIHRAKDAGKFKLAYKILQRALLLLDDNDKIYQAFIGRIRDELKTKLPPGEFEDTDDIEVTEEWTEALNDYDEALALYSSFTAVDPLAPVYRDSNIYEDRFLLSRRKLATLYFKRAEKLSEKAEIKKAIKTYKEALKLFPKSDREFHKTFQRIRQLRGQLASTNPQ
ncbi:MAG: hypothetical protein HQM08_15295 [Candidatus Riflebacteria bacterium]|nr:hypothetical protein [Candidatus Riflebacteria bacterium]